MNAKHIIASVSLIFAAGAAFAAPAELNFPSLNAAPSAGVTRAAVQAEVIRARNAGELELSEVNYPPLAATTSTLTREQVKADVLAARANGELDINEVNYPSFFDARVQRSATTLAASAKRSVAAQ